MINKIKKDYKNINDLIINNYRNYYIIYLESLVDQNKINDYILKTISNNKKILPSPNIKEIKSYKELKNFLNNGFTIIIKNKKYYSVETRANLIRSIDKPSIESSLIGPKDALVENYQINLGLIKRRIKNEHFKEYIINLGKYTDNICSILYIDNIIKKELLNKVIKNLKKINIDGINDINEIKNYLNKNKNSFPAFRVSERPDVLVNALLNGKLVILLDNSPYGLIIPSFLVDFINPIDDNYLKSININFTKIIRMLCFIISIITPALYISFITYNESSIPVSLLISFIEQRESVPFPAFIEAILTLTICEILRESDIRFPSNYGSAISILGALILGEAAVSAGFVSPIMIIITAITFISSLILTDIEMINATRTWRFIFLILASFYGLYGIFISLILLITNLSNYEILNYSYLFPIDPFDKNYIKETIIKMKNNKRSKLLSNNVKKGNI